jgi:ABC-type multidrug transport system fused ATPase/permease subunit
MDGVELSELDVLWLREHVFGLVPQEVHFFVFGEILKEILIP